MQAVMREYDKGSKDELYKDYWKLPSSWYDGGGLYVFMYEIRNPVQHGQTVVSLVKEKRLYQGFDSILTKSLTCANTVPRQSCGPF